jgi:hypothetical protein
MNKSLYPNRRSVLRMQADKDHKKLLHTAEGAGVTLVATIISALAEGNNGLTKFLTLIFAVLVFWAIVQLRRLFGGNR